MICNYLFRIVACLFQALLAARDSTVPGMPPIRRPWMAQKILKSTIQSLLIVDRKP